MKKNSKPFASKKDILWIVIILLVAGVVFFFYRQYQAKFSSLSVRITQYDMVLYQAPLIEDHHFVLPENDALVIEVKNGEAYFVSSDCPDQICVNSGVQHKAGQRAACLPNGVILQIVGQDSTETDAETT